METSNRPSTGWIGPALLVLLALVLIPLGMRAGLIPGTPATPTPEVAAVTDEAGDLDPTLPAYPPQPTQPAAATAQPVESLPVSPVDLWVYYGETTAPGQTTIWKTTANQAGAIQARQEIAVIDHQEGYPPDGSVSPDGSWLALQIVPPGAGERAARTNGREIWLVSLDPPGSAAPAPAVSRRIVAQAGFMGQWAPDSSKLVFGLRVPLEDSADAPVPFRTEMAAYDLLKGQSAVLYSNQTAYSTQPLGWAGVPGRFIVSEVDLEGQWSVVLKDPQDVSFEQRIPLPVGQAYRSISLAPGGSQLLLEKVAGDDVSLSLFSLDTGQETQVAQGKKPDLPYGPFTALWAPLGAPPGVAQTSSLFIHRLETAGQSAALERYEPDNQSLTPMMLPAPDASTFVPIHLSPDLAWIVLRDYTQTDLPLALQRVPGGEIILLPRQQPGNPMTFFGWQVR